MVKKYPNGIKIIKTIKTLRLQEEYPDLSGFIEKSKIIKVEFEYYSKDYISHAHGEALIQADYIVCCIKNCIKKRNKRNPCQDNCTNGCLKCFKEQRRMRGGHGGPKKDEGG